MAKSNGADEAADKDREKDDDMVIVEVDANGKPLAGQEDAKDKDTDDDDKDDDKGDDESEEDTRLAGNRDENTTEDNRRARQNRNESRRRAKMRDKTEINFLRVQNENLERQVAEINKRVSKTEVNGADSQISGLRLQLSDAEQIIAKAVENKNGTDVVQAMRIRDEIREDLRKAEAGKESAAEAGKSNGATRVSGVVQQNAKVFFSRVDWYDPTPGRDDDSDQIRDIELGMVARGSDPQSSAHWQKLEERVRKLFPHRFTKDDKGDEESEEDKPPQKKQANGGPRMPANGQSRGGSHKNVFQVSPERKKAMQDLGVWDDPILRKRYVKRYAQYDQDHPRT